MGVGQNIGKEVVNQVKQQAGAYIKKLAMQVASVLLKNPYFYLVVAIIIVIIIIVGTMTDIEANAAGNTEGYTSVSPSISIASGLSKGAEFLMSWENNSVRLYLLGNTTYTDNLKRVITEDKNYYICYTDYPDNDKGDRNFAYGVCHTPDLGITYYHVAEYEAVGIDIDSGSYNEVGVSKISVSNVNDVYESLYNAKKTHIREQFSGKNIEEHKLDALTAIMYQYGNIGNAVELYGTDADFVTDFKVDDGNGGYYYPLNSSNASNYKGNATRVEANKELFLNGTYKTGDGKVLVETDFSGENIVQIADKIHDYLQTNQYAYSCTHNVNDGYTNKCTCDGDSCFGKNNFDEFYNIKCIDCSAYVSWVINTYLENDKFNTRWWSGDYNDSSKWLDGWTKVDINDIQAGDILVKQGHVGIYIGDGKTLEAGCTDAIRKDYSYGSIQAVINDYEFAIRIP